MRPEQVPARPECPEPSRWTAPDSYATETDVSRLIGACVLALKPDVVVETGSYQGDTAVCIGEALKALGRGHLFTIELSPLNADQVRRRVEGLPVTVLNDAAARVEPPAPIDLLFVDSSWEDRMVEVRHFLPYASPRCVVIAHDSAVPTSYPGVPAFYSAMQSVVADGVVEPWTKLPTPRGLAITRYRS